MALATKQLEDIALEFSTFIVDGRPDLIMMVINPADDESQRRLRQVTTSAV
ncbi:MULTISPECIES: hypothetical protein [Enterobacter]|uniref:hypothetical protein n=1 Tax=Enterobacter TaxID=547 RepID=UPI0028EDA7EF|nr:hypothetical protein [Enterobacter cloacae]WNT35169.1 hypothetical protein RRL13_15445 [Enterobacter cloacae]HDR2794684.1 hypothetical protein [Enterobacter asburiae]HDR2799981.1 hypothetical protein [Enterobacter asburiae]